MRYIKHIPVAEAFPLAGQVAYQQGQIVSKTLAQNAHPRVSEANRGAKTGEASTDPKPSTRNAGAGPVSLTLFAFDQGEEISTHESKGDALVLALDGEGRITIGGQDHPLRAGEAILMPAGVPHAVFATERFKMLLTVIFPEDE